MVYMLDEEKSIVFHYALRDLKSSLTAVRIVSQYVPNRLIYREHLDY